MKKILVGLVILGLVMWFAGTYQPAYSQIPTSVGITFVSAAPSGACVNGSSLQVVVSTGALYSCQSGAWASISGGSGGSGTVTSVGVTTANGVSATGGPITGSGSFTFALGAITPTTVNNITITQPATSATLTLVQGSTLATSGAFSTTFLASANSVFTLPNGSNTLVGISNTATLSNKTFVAPVLGAATATSLLASGNVDGTAPVTITTGTTATLGGTFRSGYTYNQEATAATAVAYTLPTAAAGLQYCVGNSWNGTASATGVLTVNTSASGQFIIDATGALSGTGGHVTSGGAAADGACFVGVDATHWQMSIIHGTWTTT